VKEREREKERETERQRERQRDRERKREQRSERVRWELKKSCVVFDFFAVFLRPCFFVSSTYFACSRTTPNRERRGEREKERETCILWCVKE